MFFILDFYIIYILKYMEIPALPGLGVFKLAWCDCVDKPII